MATPGRKTKCTSKLTDEICEALRGGLPIKTACDYVGLAESTYFEWIRIANHSKTENSYTRFRDATRKALAAAEQSLVANVKLQALGDWRAAMTLLERRWPERWGRRTTVRVESERPPEDPIAELDLDNLTTEELIALEALQRKANKGA